MPNWCNNYLMISGPYEDVKKFIDEAKSKEPDGTETVLSFEKHVPMKGPEEDWYNEHCNRWGTKWDACEPALDYTHDKEKTTCGANYAFQTAWAPPCGWLVKVVELFPTLDFKMEYDEGGCECYGVSSGSEGVLSTNEMTLNEWLEETNMDYQKAVKHISEMSQEDLIKYFSRIKNFIDYLQEEEEEEYPDIVLEYQFYPLAGTIIEAIEAKNLPLFINVDWGGDEYNNRYKERMKEGK